MFKPKHRLFRRRSQWEWIEENGYIVVALLALVGGAAGWISLFDGERPQSEYATAELLAGSEPGDLTSAHASEPSGSETPSTPDTTTLATVDETQPLAATPPSAPATAEPLSPNEAKQMATAEPTPPSTNDTTAPVIAAEPKAAPATMRSAHRESRRVHVSGRRLTQRWSENAKSRPSKRASRRGRSSFTLAAVERHQSFERRSRTTPRPRMQASITPAHARPRDNEDDLDRAYVAPPRSEKLRQPPAVMQPSPQTEVRHASTSAAQTRAVECTRFFHAFGSTRRVQGDCPAGNASN